MEVGSLTEANWTEEYECISLSIILELCEEVEPLKSGGEFSHGELVHYVNKFYLLGINDTGPYSLMIFTTTYLC